MAGYDEDGSESGWVIAGLKAQIADLEEALADVLVNHGYIGDFVSSKTYDIAMKVLDKKNARSPQEE